MATINPNPENHAGGKTVIWTPGASGDTFTPFKTGFASAIGGSVQSAGSFGGATVTWQVSNNGTNWFAMLDQEQAEISETSAFYKDISSPALYIRPQQTGGSGGSVTHILVLRE